MRKLPTNEPPEVLPEFNRQRIGGKTTTLVRQVRRYELITPLFGGGIEPGVADPVSVIRGTEIRGHLRFWWRACRAAKFGDDWRQMREEENLLWGAASTTRKARPSQVHVQVEILNAGQKEQVFQTKTHARNAWREVAYVAFPLQETLGSVQTGVSFALTISFPATQLDEVQAALWAWETFGGIGARTRRGFGALRLLSVDGRDKSDVPDVKEYLRDGLDTFVVQGQGPSGVPHLTRTLHFKVTRQFTHATSPALEAWKHMIRQLRDFRQARHGRFGRSRWPEPERIRDKKLTGQRLRKHRPIPPYLEEFPRAAFGLPIIFQFKDANRTNPDDPDSDPRKTSFQPIDGERFASPLILRPFACSDTVAVGIGLILGGSSVHDLNLMLHTKEGTETHWDNIPTRLDAAKAQQILGNNGKPLLGSETDVLRAFLNKI